MSLPYLRFSRDKRGYENTFLIHSEQRRGRARTRLLYWFRTPPGVKVGRTALDAHAARMIEQANPDLTFDWATIQKGSSADVASSVPRPFEGDVRSPRPPVPGRPSRASDPPRVEPSRPAPPSRRTSSFSPPIRSAPPTSTGGERVVAEQRGESGVADAATVTTTEVTVSVTTVSAAQARLGADGLVQLRSRHAELLIRISERVPDRIRQAQLQEDAQRLNPDTWQDDDEVAQGIDRYEAVLEAIRAEVGPGRRGPRRDARPGRTAGSAESLGDRASGSSGHDSQDAHGATVVKAPEPDEEPV